MEKNKLSYQKSFVFTTKFDKYAVFSDFAKLHR